jgi:hypothetical protein
MTDPFIRDAGVNLRGLDIRVSQHFAHAFNGYASRERLRGKCMTGLMEKQLKNGQKQNDTEKS